jgi:hypothetical protein
MESLIACWCDLLLDPWSSSEEQDWPISEAPEVSRGSLGQVSHPL